MNLGEDYLFYETTATIITLVFGNYLEALLFNLHKSTKQSGEITEGDG